MANYTSNADGFWGEVFYTTSGYAITPLITDTVSVAHRVVIPANYTANASTIVFVANSSTVSAELIPQGPNAILTLGTVSSSRVLSLGSCGYVEAATSTSHLPKGRVS